MPPKNPTRIVFSQVRVGEFFFWDDVPTELLQKLPDQNLRRYGHVNCQLVTKRYYEGDTGHRSVYDDDLVILQSPLNPPLPTD